MTSSELEAVIAHTDDGHRGRLWVELAPELVAEQTYVHTGDGLIVVDHTFVPPRYEGRGIALALTRAMVGIAREKGWSIVPRCSYVAVQFKRHRDWQDLLA